MIKRNTVVKSGGFVEFNDLFHSVWRNILVNISEGSAISHSLHRLSANERNASFHYGSTVSAGLAYIYFLRAKTVNYRFRNQHAVIRPRKYLMWIMIVTLANAMFVSRFSEGKSKLGSIKS
jgi:hypothetical protein